MLLRERLGTQFNNRPVPDRSLDFLLLSSPDLFLTGIHSFDTFPFPDPLLGSNAAGLFIRSFPRFFFLSLGHHVWTKDHMVKDCSRVNFRSWLIWLHTLSWQKLLSSSIGCRRFSPGNSENDEGHYMTFLRIFDWRIRLNDTRVEAVEESAALQDNFPETEGGSQLLLSCSAWHPIEHPVH
jgi:hypothetical protein